MARAGERRASQIAKDSPAFRAAAKSLGRRVRALRLERQLTLEAAAERGDLDLKHWQKIEAGQLNVTLVTLVRIGRGLSVELAALFSSAEKGAARRKHPKKRP